MSDAEYEAAGHGAVADIAKQKRRTRMVSARSDRLARKAAFIRGLAIYLAEEQSKKSIQLQMNQDHAKEWARLRNLSGLFGYPTVDEAEESLQELLG